jgi:hypothetical protein
MLNFSINENKNEVIAKDALIFVEGSHVDARKTPHVFSRDRVLNIVKNTNDRIKQGYRIPWQLDHKKTQDANIGDLQGALYTKVIEDIDDLPNPEHTHLIGKLGVFAKNMIAKGADIVEKVKAKSISTLSPGIDPSTESIIEISATPYPAILGPALFGGLELQEPLLLFAENEKALDFPESESEGEPVRKKRNKKVFTMEEALGFEVDQNLVEKEFVQATEALWKVLSSYHSATEEELKGKNPIEGSYNAIQYYVGKLEEIFALVDDEDNQKQPEKDESNPGTAEQIVKSKGSIKSKPGEEPDQQKFSRFSSETINFAREKRSFGSKFVINK